MAVFQRFFIILLIFIGSFSAFFFSFWWFLFTKAANLANYGLWNSEKAPQCYIGGFLAVFVRFFAVFHYFSNFLLPNRIIWQIWIVKYWKTSKPPKWRFFGDFGRFLCSFSRFFAVFRYFSYLLLPNQIIWQIMDSEILKNRQTAKLAVFGGFTLFQ